MSKKFNIHEYLAKIAQDEFSVPARNVEEGIERLLEDVDKIRDENNGK